MDLRDIYDELVRWTPFLAGGFLWNIVIAIAAMAIGTIGGSALAFMRTSGSWPAIRISTTLTAFFRNVPTFVFLFYLVYLLPTQIVILGATLSLPLWLKAALALSMAVFGFMSDNLTIVLREWRAGRHDSALLLIPSWTSYLLIIVMASSTASVIGVSEIVSRCNTVISATGRNELIVWIYLYAMSWFFLFCYPLTRAMTALRNTLRHRAWITAPRRG
jgi:polar amino acid transport system permease protein